LFDASSGGREVELGSFRDVSKLFTLYMMPISSEFSVMRARCELALKRRTATRKHGLLVLEKGLHRR
jgi:hypothetical protein